MGHELGASLEKTKKELHISSGKNKNDNGAPHRKPLDIWMLQKFENSVFCEGGITAANLCIAVFFELDARAP